MNFAFALFTVVAIGLSSVLTGCGGGGDITTTTTTTTTLFDSHVKWVSSLLVQNSSDVAILDSTGFGPSVGANSTVYVPALSYGAGLDEYTVLYALFALDGDDGVAKWQFNLMKDTSGVPTVGPDGSIYVLTGDHIFETVSVVAVNDDGSEKWIREFNSSKTGHPPVPVLGLGDVLERNSVALGSDGTVFMSLHWGSPGSRLFALDGDDGTMKWQGLLGEDFLSTPAVAPDNTIFVTGVSNTTNIFAVQGADGSLKWSVPFPFDASSPTIGANGTVLVCSSEGLVALDGHTGSVKWQQQAACLHKYANLGHPAVGADGTIFVQSASNGYEKDADKEGSLLLALNGDNGSIQWSFNATIHAFDTACSPAAVSIDGTVYIGFEHSLYALDAQSGEVRWNSTTHNNGVSFSWGSAPPVIGPDGTVFVVTDHSLVALHGEGGPVTAPYQLELAQGLYLV